MVVYVALLLLAVGVARLWRKRQIGKRRSPLSQLLLRSPGESLNKELDDTFSDALL
jgi:hypothetical protein